MAVVKLSKADAAVAKPSKVLLELEVRPARAKATILFRGKEYRQNSLELLVPPAETEEVLRVEAPGYMTVKKSITVNSKVKLKHVIELERIRIRIRPMGPKRPKGPDDDLKSLPGGD